MRILKIFFSVILFVPLLASLAAYGVLSSFDFEKNQEKIESYILSKTGYNVHFQKPQITFFPAPLFKAENITVDAFYGKEPLFKADNIFMQMTWKDMLFMDLGIEKLAVDNPSVYLRVNEYGYANWEKKRSKRKQKNHIDLSFIKTFGEIVISDAYLLYENDSLGERFLLNEGILGLSGLNMNKVTVDAQAVLNGQLVHAQGTVDLSKNEENPAFDLSVNIAEENTIFLKGALKNALIQPHFEGDISVKGPSLLSALYEILHIAPEQRGFVSPINLSAYAVLDEENVHLSSLDFDLGTPENKAKILGKIHGKFNKSRPEISLDIRFPEHVNASVFGFCQTSSDEANAFEWSTERLDFSPLMANDISAKMLFEQGVSCQKMHLPHLDMTASVTEKGIHITPLVIKEGSEGAGIVGEFSLKGKRSYKGEIALNIANATPSSWLDTSFNQRIKMPLSGTNTYQFHGATPYEWVSSLSGYSDLYSEEIEVGGLAGGSLVGIVRYVLGKAKVRPAGLSKKGLLRFSSETNKGVMRLTSASLQTEDLSVGLSGKIDIKRMAMNVHVLPLSSDILDLTVPVLIKGHLSEPTIVPDPGSFQNQAALIGAGLAGVPGAVVGSHLGKLSTAALKPEGKDEEKEEKVDPLLEFIRKKVNE